MIQATDFVCPTCKAQVGKQCVNFEKSFAFGKIVNKPIHRFGKPHADRRRLARNKRLARAADAAETRDTKGGEHEAG